MGGHTRIYTFQQNKREQSPGGGGGVGLKIAKVEERKTVEG